MQIHKISQKQLHMVYVRCMTFNHEAYIKDALNGYAMQRTNFPFIVGIIDDASTDNTTSVINEFVKKNCIFNPETEVRKEEYGTVLDVTHKDNPHCIFHIVYLKDNHYGKKSKLPYFIEYENAAKYVAVCEGDDYWTDPLKLQKQVDFLENHSEYDMVCARFNHLVHETGEIQTYDLYDQIISLDSEGIEIKQEHFVSFAQPHPCTVMFRKGTLTDHPIIPTLKYKFDIPIYFCFLFLHRCWLMNEKVAVYRKHAGSLTLSGETENWSLVASHKELLSHFPNDPNLQQLVQYDEKNNLIRSSLKNDFNWFYFFKELNIYTNTYSPDFNQTLYIIKRVLKNRIKKYMKKP